MSLRRLLSLQHTHARTHTHTVLFAMACLLYSVLLFVYTVKDRAASYRMFYPCAAAATAATAAAAAATATGFDE